MPIDDQAIPADLFQFQNALDQLRSSKGEDIVMVIEVPGVRREDLRIEAKGNTIRIRTARRMTEITCGT